MKTNFKFPKIGMRMIKTAIAAFICAMLGYFRGQLPFYSMIAAILCLQPSLEKSTTIALNRTIGTFIGGAVGFVVLLLVNHAHIIVNVPSYYLLISICLIPLIYLTVLLEKTPSSYITCVVFLSITISHISDELPILFVMHRIMDTLIGIGVSLLINRILPNHSNSEIK
ncbi:MAG: FUSC family protein [Oscillospiraceae bacterium]